MKSSWETKRLRDLPLIFVDGDRSSRYPKRSEFVSEGILFLNAESIKDGFVNLEAANYISSEKFSTIKKGRLQKGDVLLTMRGNGVGQVAFFAGIPSTGIINAQMLILRSECDALDSHFFYYLLFTPFYFARLRSLATGSAQPQLSITSLRELEISIPQAEEQKKIAAILSVYDDLIENNLRRIKILEEMAQTLYREWFVKFRFPGHQHARFTDSPLGRIPEGWEVVNLLDITVVKYGKTLPTKNLAPDGDYPVYGAAKIIGRYTEYTREERTIITGCRGSVGEMQITLPKCFVTNNSFTFEVQQRIDFFWLFHSLKERGFADVIGGAAQPQITLDGLSKVQILVPLKATRALFHERAEDMFSLLWNLEGRNTTLRRTRDLLLPKLISGEVDVSELDIAVPEEVEA